MWIIKKLHNVSTGALSMTNIINCWQGSSKQALVHLEKQKEKMKTKKTKND